MPKHVIKLLVFLFIVLLVSGCSSSKVRVRSYMQDKTRVDQKMSGNAGYLLGTPVFDEAGEKKTTRKIYVLEFSKDAPANQEGNGANIVKYKRNEDSGSDQMTTQEIQTRRLTQVDLPSSSGEMVGTVIVENSLVEYIVEKDDTLQKISKKFYGEYSKWPKIYEYNKDAIENPDFVRPGTVLQIPIE
ncbi:MAG: LysM peptidoglycan-binding domain-containing protein [Candidatus Omnitrophica bacterium]|nr:LysM peptidoglycan-binding domain-containing protein [Candidatus Omnitrophota bacterium]MBU1995578.1 LysM peptidoglycan-binding domain-containing protein [Candidatus Omnitrophota bacterium]MBU4332891.1 LysM peptidoglycan-binding domain-containing protein [Candidatus Omnitrophota bacterium]